MTVSINRTNAPAILIELFGESNAPEAARKCLTDPWFAALVKVAQMQRESMKYARDQLATLAETDHYGNAVANAFVELAGALETQPDAKKRALLTAALRGTGLHLTESATRHKGKSAPDAADSDASHKAGSGG